MLGVIFLATGFLAVLLLWPRRGEMSAYEHRIIANRDSNVIPFRKRRPF